MSVLREYPEPEDAPGLEEERCDTCGETECTCLLDMLPRDEIMGTAKYPEDRASPPG